jgi:hypothetical protein
LLVGTVGKEPPPAVRSVFYSVAAPKMRSSSLVVWIARNAERWTSAGSGPRIALHGIVAHATRRKPDQFAAVATLRRTATSLARVRVLTNVT